MAGWVVAVEEEQAPVLGTAACRSFLSILLPPRHGRTPGAFLNPLTLPLRQSICQGGHLSDATTPPLWREAPPRGAKRGDFLANLARRHFGLKLLIQQEMEEWLHHRG